MDSQTKEDVADTHVQQYLFCQHSWHVALTTIRSAPSKATCSRNKTRYREVIGPSINKPTDGQIKEPINEILLLIRSK